MLLSQASNIKPANSSVYTAEEFLTFYPQFTNTMPESVLNSFLALANACVSDKRYGALWKLCIGLFTAHFCTLYLQTAQDADSSAAEVLAKCSAAGVVTSESAYGVSYSLDTSAISSDLNGWAGFKLTSFGVQFATYAKLVGKGGMYVW